MTNDKNWGDVYHRYLARGHDHGSAAYAADQWEKRHDPYRYFDGATFKEDERCKRCGRALNGEAAQVDDEVWCHACADEGPVKYKNTTTAEK